MSLYVIPKLLCLYQNSLTDPFIFTSTISSSDYCIRTIKFRIILYDCKVQYVSVLNC